jgi:acyl-CoA reductase-like NAD-dependent aldehyde dehydrogenase
LPSATPGRSLVARVRESIERARAAQTRWAATPIRRRLAIVRRTRAVVGERAADFATVASARLASTAQALAVEVLPLADACRFLEREAACVLAPRRPGRRGRPAWLTGVELSVRREPYGVVLIVGPSNYPLYLVGVQTMQALAAGNAVVLKPGDGGTPAARALRDALIESGLDPDLVAVLPEPVESTGVAIEAGVDKVVLTGSADAGRSVLARLAPRLVPATMELSGCDAVFVRSDADLDLVAGALRFGLALNDGATCIAPRRVFVARNSAPELEARLVRALAGAKPVAIAPRELARIRLLLDEAVGRGARVLAGGDAEDGSFVPLVVADVSPESALAQADIGAPVLSLIPVASDDEALLADAKCPYALGASVFGSSAACERLAARVGAGIVVVNDIIAPSADPRLPFGGRGASGFGVTRGAEGLLEMTTTKAISVRRRGPRRQLERERPGDAALFLAYARLAHADGLSTRLAALGALARALVARLKRNSGTDQVQKDGRCSST